MDDDTRLLVLKAFCALLNVEADAGPMSDNEPILKAEPNFGAFNDGVPVAWLAEWLPLAISGS